MLTAVDRADDVLFFFQGEDGIRDDLVTGVQTCALPISSCTETRSGSGKYRGSLCMMSCEIRTLVFAGNSYSPSRKGASARRPITQTGGYKRIDSRSTVSV